MERRSAEQQLGLSKMQCHKKTKIKRLGETILDLKEISIVKQLFSN